LEKRRGKSLWRITKKKDLEGCKGVVLVRGLRSRLLRKNYGMRIKW